MKIQVTFDLSDTDLRNLRAVGGNTGRADRGEVETFIRRVVDAYLEQNAREAQGRDRS